MARQLASHLQFVVAKVHSVRDGHRIDSIVSYSMFTRLQQKYPEADSVLLTARLPIDLQQLAKEVAEIKTELKNNAQITFILILMKRVYTIKV